MNPAEWRNGYGILESPGWVEWGRGVRCNNAQQYGLN